MAVNCLTISVRVRSLKKSVDISKQMKTRYSLIYPASIFKNILELDSGRYLRYLNSQLNTSMLVMY